MKLLSPYKKVQELEWQLSHQYSDRYHKLMQNFHPDAEMFRKIIEMNDGLHDRFKMAYDQVVEMKKNIDEDIKRGRLNITGYSIYVDYFFGYCCEDGIPTADEYTLMNLSDGTDIFFPRIEVNSEDEKIPDFEKDILNYDPELNWSIEKLDYPQLKNHYIYMFMHHIFDDADTFCPADIQYLKPEHLEWQIVVEYEHFKKTE